MSNEWHLKCHFEISVSTKHFGIVEVFYLTHEIPIKLSCWDRWTQLMIQSIIDHWSWLESKYEKCFSDFSQPILGHSHLHTVIHTHAHINTPNPLFIPFQFSHIQLSTTFYSFYIFFVTHPENHNESRLSNQK